MSSLRSELAGLKAHYEVCGLIDRKGRVYPLGADTKVLSTAFELIVRPLVYQVAKKHDLRVVEPKVQNHYPDFTLLRDERDKSKIAVDVKTTYRGQSGRFGFTLGGYTSFIKEGNERKNIVFPFNEYSFHCVIGFVYDRLVSKKSAAVHTYPLKELSNIPLPFGNVEAFVQEKWRIASDRAGSGNTTNIGSIEGTLDDFVNGKGLFASEKEFLEYWRGYKKTSQLRDGFYDNVSKFRSQKKPS